MLSGVFILSHEGAFESFYVQVPENRCLFSTNEDGKENP